MSPLTRSASSTASAGVRPGEELLDAAVDEPQPRLQVQDGLADDGEPEVAGLDHAGVHRADRDLVHPGALDGAERVRAVGVAEAAAAAPGVGEHRVPAAGPVEVPDQPAGQRVVVGHDAEQVVHLAFEPAGGERQPGQAGHPGPAAVERHVQLDPAVRRGGGEQVHGAQPRLPPVLVPGDQRDPEPGVEQRRRLRQCSSPGVMTRRSAAGAASGAVAVMVSP